MRKFKDHAPISDAEKNYWIDSFGSTQMSHLMEYTHSFYVNQALQDGTFCLTVQTVIQITMDISPFLDNLNGLWSDSNNKMARDCNEQALYNPARVYLSPASQHDRDNSQAQEATTTVTFVMPTANKQLIKLTT